MNQSPWITIWTKPRETIAQIVLENPKRGIWGLAWIYGFLSLINGIQSFVVLGGAAQFFIFLFFAVILAPFWGMLLFGIWSFVVYWIGKWLKGQGTFLSVRAAFAWSSVPLAINIILWALTMLLFENETAQMVEPRTGPMFLVFVILLAKIVVVIWSLVIYINGLAEVQQFSVARAVGNIVLSWLAIAILIFVVWIGLSLIIQIQAKGV